MKRRWGPWVKWLLVATGLLSTSCAGAIGVGAGLAVVGAGVLAFTCYDRVSVTVTDRVTGTQLCDAKVEFLHGTSVTEATSCYQAALSAGKYTLRVQRHGLQPFEEPVEVTEGRSCGQSVQTMYVALERLNAAPAPPVATAASAAPPVAAASPAVSAPSAAPASPLPPASAAPAAPQPVPAPAATAFPDAP